MTDPTERPTSTSTQGSGSTAPPGTPPAGSTPPGWGPDWGWSRRHRRDNGGLFFGVVLLLIGGYFLLRDTLHIRIPDIGELWPIFLIALGLWILLSAARRSDRL
jgi:hypothetical protein